MIKLFSFLLLIFTSSIYSQNHTMNDTIKLIINKKTKIDDSLSISLNRFSHKNAISDEQASVTSSHLTLFKDETKDEIILSAYESADEVSYLKKYDSINWKNYRIKLKHIEYDKSVDVLITKNHISIKDKLITEANKIIASKYPEFVFDPALYEITVWKNSKKTIVKYRRIIRFTPLKRKNENLSFDFEINLTNKSILPFDIFGFERFYFPTIEEQEKIDFVVTNFGLPYSGFNNSIIEDPNKYYINIDNDTSFGRYCIDKITGKEFMDERIQGSYEPMPHENLPELINTDPLIEIK